MSVVTRGLVDSGKLAATKCEGYVSQNAQQKIITVRMSATAEDSG